MLLGLLAALYTTLLIDLSVQVRRLRQDHVKLELQLMLLSQKLDKEVTPWVEKY